MTRDELRSTLHRRLSDCSDVLATWEAGSAAFARDDAMSDLDVGLLVREGSIEHVWLEDLPDDALRAIERLRYVESPTALVSRVEEASQIFTQPLGALRERGIEPLDSKCTDVFAGAD